jgi:transcriptional regulator GlxA family with amidase domain
MKHVSILVPKGELVVSSLVGPFKVFHAVNQYYQSQGLEPYYDVRLIGYEKSVQYDGLFSIDITDKPTDVKKTDLIVICACRGNMDEVIEWNQPLLEWVKEMHAHGAEVASLCMGAFLLADTGLLDNKPCTTHWMGHELFAQMFPQVNLMAYNIITEDRGVYTSGGAYSFLNLLLHLVEKFNGRDAAIFVSKMFEIDVTRRSQQPFVIFNQQKTHQDNDIMKVQTFIEENYNGKLSIQALADSVAMSKRSFIRKFKQATSNTPLEYIQRVKIEAAKKQFESQLVNVKEVMYQVGYNDPKAFRDIFKRHTGLSPNDYKTRYHRVLEQPFAQQAVVN